MRILRSVKVDGSVTYKDWINGLSDEERQALELAQRKDSRAAADKVQYAKYVNTLGTETVPKTFDKFQELKYTDSEKWAELKSLYAGINNGTIIKNATGNYVKKVNRATLKETPNSILQVENAKGGITRNYYGDNALRTKQISNNDHGHIKESKFGKHGEHAHDYCVVNGELKHQEPRELTDEERKENADIL